MKRWCFKLCALLMTLALMPGVFEVLENSAHLVTEGHLAHAAADGDSDRHEQTDPEHGCTTIFHSCGCHASIPFLAVSETPKISLRDAGIFALPGRDRSLMGFFSRLDRPPQVA